MNTVHRFTKFLLTHVPAPLRKGIRRLTPQWAYQAIARSSAGQSFFADEPGQLFLSDKRVIRLEERLWQGFAGVALAELDDLLDARHPDQRRAEAAMALARFHAAGGADGEALERLRLAGHLCPALGTHRRARIIEIHALSRLGRHAEAIATAEQALRERPTGHGDLHAARASVILAAARQGDAPAIDASALYLDGLNQPLEQAGLVGIALRDPAQPLAIGNLAPGKVPPQPTSMPVRISVLMAAHNRRDRIPHAIASVLAQTWQNLELVIVDDASTDDSWSVIQSLAACDKRIVPMRHAVNRGAYVARNTALQQATGDLVTVHDADDWSHPQKLEVQAITLLRDKGQCGNTTAWIRVARDMQVQPRLDLFQVPIIHKNFSSLMLPREKALALGGWDTVRMSADAEFIERLQAGENGKAPEELLPGVPLSLSLLEDGNLTTTSASGIRTSQFGARHAYARQYREWHRSGHGLHMSRRSQTVPFPVPGICCHGESAEATFDAIVVSDFRTLEILRACRRKAGTLAILPWPDYQHEYDLAVSDAVSRWCRETGTVTLVHGEQARCKRLLIDPARVMLYPMDRIPVIRADEVLILDHGGMRARDHDAIGQRVALVFGVEPRWATAATS